MIYLGRERPKGSSWQTDMQSYSRAYDCGRNVAGVSEALASGGCIAEQCGERRLEVFLGTLPHQDSFSAGGRCMRSCRGALGVIQESYLLFSHRCPSCLATRLEAISLARCEIMDTRWCCDELTKAIYLTPHTVRAYSHVLRSMQVCALVHHQGDLILAVVR